MTDDKDDWLDDLGTSEEAGEFGELDQNTIDQLLGGSGESKQAAPEEAGEPGELDQNTIDQLLGGSSESKQAAPEEAGEPGELDQNTIDQLLGGSGESKQAAPVAENRTATTDSVEIDQDSLDALLNGEDDQGNDDFFASSSGPANEAGPLDQSSIDALFGSDDADFQAALEDNSNVPSQADIDELFAQAQEDGVAPPASAQETAPANDNVDLDDLFGESPSAGSSAAGEDDFGFDAGSFAMDGPTASGKAAAVPRSRQEEATLDEDIFGDETILEPTMAAAAGAKPWRKALPVHFLAGVSRRSLGGLLAAVLLVGGGGAWFVLHDRAPKMVPPPQVAVKPPVPEAAPAPAVVNTPPEAKGAELKMAEGGGEIPLLLAAKDKEGDALTYEITTQPQHGRLSGELPTPVYLPNTDFPGQDRVEYRVSDGKAHSQPVAVLITGPDLRPKPGSEKAVVAETRPPVLQARNLTLRTLSTRELVIDWRKVWQQANKRPFSPEVRVEIVGKNLHGELKQLDPRKHHYRPERLFRGTDRIKFRFKKGEASSKIAELRLVVEPGDSPPKIRLREQPAESYLVGETVVLDASPTVDDEPATLSFTWRQEGGTPVQLERLNAEGSMVSFVVPSAFSTQENPGPVLRVTAMDGSGQKTEEVVKIATRSRRQSALWQGAALQGGGLAGAEARPSSSALRPGFVTH